MKLNEWAFLRQLALGRALFMIFVRYAMGYKFWCLKIQNSLRSCIRKEGRWFHALIEDKFLVPFHGVVADSIPHLCVCQISSTCIPKSMHVAFLEQEGVLAFVVY